MKVNPDIFHFLLSDRKIYQMVICINKLSSTCREKLLGIKIDNELTFKEDVERLYKKSHSESQYTVSNFIFNEILTQKTNC